MKSSNKLPESIWDINGFLRFYENNANISFKNREYIKYSNDFIKNTKVESKIYYRNKKLQSISEKVMSIFRNKNYDKK